MNAFVAALVLTLSAPQSVPYRWKSVQMVGAGFVDGIVFHPTARGVAYARTDMGGAYRWDGRHRQWQPILDWVPYKDLNLMGVESIAVDPHDSNRVYLACGTYTNPSTPNGAILRSTDRGRSWKRTDVPIKFGGNENGRGNGERMTVDPNDGANLFLGTRHAGLWQSHDCGATWSKAASFGDPEPSIPVVVVADKAVYSALSISGKPNLMRSKDGGRTWSTIEGEPTETMPTHMVLGGDGNLWITYGSSPGPSPMSNGAAWKLDTRTDRWTEVTPEKPDPANGKRFGYAAVSVQRDKPDAEIVSTFGHPGGEQIFRTTDGGKTWKPVIGGRETYDVSKAPYTARVGIHWLLDIEIDPNNPNHALFTTGYGGHETFNLTDADKGKPVRWSLMSKGIEESVALELASPTKGAHLISAIGDYGGFVHWDLDKPVPDGNFVNPHFGNTSSVAVAAEAPNVVVRVGRASGFDKRVNIGYSLDFGRTWQPANPPTPNASQGHIVVSCDGSTWVWSLRASYVTRDRGATWTECQGLPGGIRVASDGTGDRFYALDLYGGKLYTSDDRGVSFHAADLVLPGGLPKRGERGDGRGGQDQLYVTPGRRGDLWIAAFDGLYHSTDTGAAFSKLEHVEQIHAFGYGKAAPGHADPALYLVGTVDGQRGVFRSNDFARSWVRINDEAHQWGLVLQITGDPKRYGRAYVGTHGRGTFYGDPVG